MKNCIVVTGGAGFIGSNFVNEWVRLGLGKVVNLDKLTYAGNLEISLRFNTTQIMYLCMQILVTGKKCVSY